MIQVVPVIRPAQPDLPQLPRVVGGRAAAPSEWDVWAEEPGHALVALADGQPVGGVHVSMVGRTEAWVENLRVHPDWQGRGIARQLVSEAEQSARRYGAAVARTAIPAHEYAALAVAERGGYRRVIHSVALETAVDPGPMHVPYDAPVEVPAMTRAQTVTLLIERLPVVQAWERMVPLGWRFRRVVPELVRGLMKDRRVLVAGELDAAGVLALRTETIVISLLDGTASGMQAVYGTAIERARSEGAKRVVLFAADARSPTVLGERRWRPHAWCPDGLIVVEKSLVS